MDCLGAFAMNATMSLDDLLAQLPGARCTGLLALASMNI